MLKKRIEVSSEVFSDIVSKLYDFGVSNDLIERIMFSSYNLLDSEDVKDIFGSREDFKKIFELLRDGYPFRSLVSKGCSKRELLEFISKVQGINLTVDNVLSINKYSLDSGLILDRKRGKSKESIRSSIIDDLIDKLDRWVLTKKQIASILDFVNSRDLTLHLFALYDSTYRYCLEHHLGNSIRATINTCLLDLYNLFNVDRTIKQLEDTMRKNAIPCNLVVYRGIKNNISVDDLSKNDGYMSTSLFYNSSFAKYDSYDMVLELYVPKGTNGIYITNFSDFDTEEEEVLIDTSRVVFFDIDEHFVDMNGKKKRLLKGIVLTDGLKNNKRVSNSINIKK